MKFLEKLNLRLFMLLFVAAAVGLSGCGDDEDEETKKLNPEITVDGVSIANNATIEPGQEARLKFAVAKGADGKDLDEVNVQFSLPGGQLASWDGYPKKEIKAANFSDDLKLPATVEGSYQFLITARDRDGNSSTRSINFTVKKKDGPGPTPAKAINGAIFTNTNAYMRTGHSNPTTLDANSAQTVAAEIDLSYFYSTSNSNHSFIAPQERTKAIYDGTDAKIAWGVQATRFYIGGNLNDANFTAAKADVSKLEGFVTSGSLSTWPSNADGARVGGTSIGGQVYGFKNGNGKHGMIKVKTVGANSAEVDIIVEN